MTNPVMLVVIGDRWLRLINKAGQRRLDDENDFVRIEIETALQRRIPVVPILIDGASMPATDVLPASLGELTFQQGTIIRPDPDFHNDMDRIIHALETHGIKPLPVAQPDLEIVSVRSTPDFELDVTLRNTGSEPAVIHQIDLTLVEDHGVCLPIICPFGKVRPANWKPSRGRNSKSPSRIMLSHMASIGSRLPCIRQGVCYYASRSLQQRSKGRSLH